MSRTITNSNRIILNSIRSNNINSSSRILKGKFTEIHSDSINLNQSTETPIKRRASSVKSPNKYISPRPTIPLDIKRKPSTNNNKNNKSSTAVTTKTSSYNEDLDDVPPPLADSALSLLFTLTNPPPISALSAFANRLTLSTNNQQHSLAKNLPLLEQCLIHPSFWTVLSTLSPTSTPRKFTNYHDIPFTSTNPTLIASTHAHNGSLASLGNSILGCLTSELILSSFPNLPSRVTKAALTLYAGPKSLASIVNSWGVGPSRLDLRLVGDTKGDKGRGTRKEMAYGHLVGGVGPAKKMINQLDGAGGMSLVRWNRKPTTPSYDQILHEDALASVGRALIGAIHQEHGFAAAKSFVHAHFLSRLLPTSSSSLAPPAASLDLLPLLKFTNPTQVLTSTLISKSLASPTHSLLRESGRLSSHPTFLTGVFSGEIKLGEGFGSSLKMSEWRASEDALRRFYLGGKDISGSGLPSDAWGSSSKGEFLGLTLGESEVKDESAGRGLRVGGAGTEQRAQV